MDQLNLTIIYRGEEMELPLRAYTYGYTYRLDVKVGEEMITFEPDEEGRFRAFAGEKIDKELVRVIANALEKLR